MNVLSLFDGMSCGQIALTELGCFPDKYYASEVDKFAIQQTMSVFPDTIQLGDVTKVDVSQLDKIDLLIGGSPCQSFSFAGKQVGVVTTDKVDITDLQTVPEWYEWVVSDTQIYRMCGNGWTVKVIEHILGHLFI
jgi:site-specific DNA-cytosine methylase